MAKTNTQVERISRTVDQTIDQTADAPLSKAPDTTDVGPSYRLATSKKIPVSKKLGSLWQGRVTAANELTKALSDAWKEAIRYYHNDQMAHRTINNDERSGNRLVAIRDNSKWSETENMVFATVASQLPMLYAKNPIAEFTAEVVEDKDAAAYADMVEDLINSLAAMRIAPGFNLKPKARQAVVSALLTNEGWIEIGYTLRENSTQKFLEELDAVSKKLQEAKTPADIQDAEGELMALDEKYDALRDEGPYCNVRSPIDVVVDPTSVEIDHTDANWIALSTLLPTSYLNAVYGKEDKGAIVSVFEPTHVLRAAVTGENGSAEDTKQIQQDINNFSLFNKGKNEYKDYGYSSQSAFDSACFTKCWTIWDRITRRIYLFMDNYWVWPLWVFDDPYGLPEFFPFYKLSFHTSPNCSRMKGETSYYLDQQDAINEMNDEARRARLWVKRNLFFNSNLGLSKDDVEQVLKGPDGTVRGVNLPEGMKFTDVIFTVPPPALAYPTLFDKSDKYAVIDRITGTSAAERGEQFKTNTTNKAIDYYNSRAQFRNDEKIDLIEDWLGRVMGGLAALCCKFMPESMVQQYIGTEAATGWINMEPRDFYAKHAMRIVGGSTQKPTSDNKKAEAINLSQALGQFANAAPGAIVVMLKIMERAFDDFVITEEDWKTITDSLTAQMQKGVSTGASPPGAQQPPTQPGAEQAGGDEQTAVAFQQIASQLPPQFQEVAAQLPPQLQAALVAAVNQGVDPAEAIQRILQVLNSQGAK
jgi:hypothetical protein